MSPVAGKQLTVVTFQPAPEIDAELREVELRNRWACERSEQAANDLVEFWKVRSKKCERLLRQVLSSDHLPLRERAEIVGHLVGADRDAKLLTRVEAELVAEYRASTPKHRHAIVEVARAFGAADRQTAADTD
jgi:hypothetical protein